MRMTLCMQPGTRSGFFQQLIDRTQLQVTVKLGFLVGPISTNLFLPLGMYHLIRGFLFLIYPGP